MKQAGRLGLKFLCSISLKPSSSINEQFEQASKYYAYEYDLAAASNLAMTVGDGTTKPGRTSSQHRRADHDSRRSTLGRENTRYNNSRKDSADGRDEVKFTLPLEKVLLQAHKEAEFDWRLQCESL